ncbi:MAG: glycosyl hydrolase, partial [Myxococcota bacterium]
MNRGNSWTPIFDDQPSYSLGCVEVDPRNSSVVWLGTGENTSNRSVGYGDGIYKSTDAGRTWRRMGLENSEHIQRVLIDPRDSDVVYVASQGPLWAPGGDRGLYKTTDGGQHWTRVLQVSEDTGITDVVLDPQDPDVIFAAAYQRRRAVGQTIGGGPEAGIFKSTDGGATWARLKQGLPSGHVGRIALAVDKRHPGRVYALVVAQGDEGGFFVSENAGADWTRTSDYSGGDPQYYGEIFVDPHRPDSVWALDVQFHRSVNAGRSFEAVRFSIHVDQHDLVFDEEDPKHLLVGNDGGLYETWDGGNTWRHFTNLPLSQFYRVGVDGTRPFYNVAGGSQDNGSILGPSRTHHRVGIRTSDWQRIGGGDGFQARFDPEEPNIVYRQSQNGALGRLDLRTGKSRSIRPPRLRRSSREGDKDEATATQRWHWDSPLIISPHAPQRLYYAGHRLYRSDDRGDNWSPVSPDLTRDLDRDAIPIMGQIWPKDAVGRHLYTTTLSVISALDESPLREGLIYVGTDDGLFQATEDGGKSWRRVERFPGLPVHSYVTDVFASPLDADTVFVTFNNWQRGDFRPYVYKSTDQGRNWSAITGNLPSRSGAWSIVQDHVDRDLLFVGMEFGVFFSVDGGRDWVQLKGGMPSIQARDLLIQRRENDLVVGTFGRGVYILDDYSALRSVD